MDKIQYVMQDPSLTLQAKAIYIYFYQQSSGNDRFAIKPPKDIQQELNIGACMYYSHLKKLIDHGYIKIEKVRNNRQQYNGSECVIVERTKKNEQ